MPKSLRFDVPGYKWERRQDDAQWALHIEIGDEEHFVLWQYDNCPEYCAVSYIKNQFTRPEAEQWLDPMEAMCLALEKAAQASRKRSSE